MPSFRAVALLALLAACAALAQAQHGVAITPRNFPAHTPADVDQAFVLARQLGRHAVFISQWAELDRDVVRTAVDKARRLGLVPVLGLSPTTLDRGRKELDVPERVRRAAGAGLSFAHPEVRKAFVEVATALARLEPPYLCLATEINLLAMQRLPEFLHFVTLYREAYRKVKRVSPATRVFVTFQWEWMRILDAREPERIAEHSKVIEVFRPQLDLAGFTSYPAPFHRTPAELAPDYYTWMLRHIPAGEPVMLMEVGWPSSGSGSEAEQLAFIERLPGLLKGINLVGLEWALLHDVDVGAFDADLNSAGLRRRDGRPKPGYEAFKRLAKASRGEGPKPAR